MEEIYQTIIEYKNLYPAMFWALFSLISLFILYAVAKPFYRKGNVQEIQRNIRKWAPQKNNLDNDEQSSIPDFETTKIKPQERVSPKGNRAISQESQEFNEPEKDYKVTESSENEANDIKSVKKTNREKEELPEVKKEPKKEIKQSLFVNYESNLKDNISSYPVFMCPKKGCVVRSYREGSTKRRGYKEKYFQISIEEYFSPDLTVSGDIRINTGKDTRPFEPDIAILDLKSDKNIRIDIEIDEPYAGITRQATHCDDEDYLRDSYYVDRGWIVIRFSEYQVHAKTESCLKFIAEVINSIDPQFKIPPRLQTSDDVGSEEFWSILQAQKWERQNYREKYLNHTFRPVDEIEEIIERDFNETDNAEEQLVKPSAIGVQETTQVIGFNKKNSHPKDKRIKFYPEPHVYTIDNVTAVSASSIVSKFFPVFDTKHWAERKAMDYGMTALEVEKMWADKGNEAMLKGTELHQQIEKFYLGMDLTESTDFQLFKSFHNDHQNLKPYRSEWRIFDEENLIAGTIDLIVRNVSYSYDMYDWKRSKKVVDPFGNPITSNSWQRGVGELSQIDDTSFNRYSLQQSLYRYILEKNYNININNMYLVVMHPNYERYHKVETPYLIDEVQYMLNTL